MVLFGIRLVAFWWFCAIQRKPDGVYQFHDFAISCACRAGMCVINSCGAYNMVEEMDKDYVRTAIGNGVPYATVIRHNVLRNALITPVTVLGLRVGYLLGGAVVIEQIFDLPGWVN